jgi:hypothetical protein
LAQRHAAPLQVDIAGKEDESHTETFATVIAERFAADWMQYGSRRGRGYPEPGSCYFSRGQLTLFHQAILIHILTFYLIPFLHFFFS